MKEYFSQRSTPTLKVYLEKLTCLDPGRLALFGPKARISPSTPANHWLSGENADDEQSSEPAASKEPPAENAIGGLDSTR